MLLASGLLPHVINRRHFNTPSLKSMSAFTKNELSRENKCGIFRNLIAAIIILATLPSHVIKPQHLENPSPYRGDPPHYRGDPPPYRGDPPSYRGDP